jgi:hypothetical protein
MDKSVMLNQNSHLRDLPLSRPNNFGLSTAGQKNRKKRKPDTLLYEMFLRKSPYRSSAQERM